MIVKDFNKNVMNKYLFNKKFQSILKLRTFQKTRADIVKEVNLKLLPFIQTTFVYVVVLSWVYWMTIIFIA